MVMMIKKKKLSSIHKFRQKVFFFWTGLNNINTNMTPYYCIELKYYNSTKHHVHMYPIAHTCSNELEFPVYVGEIEMFQYLLKAISYEGFGFD